MTNKRKPIIGVIGASQPSLEGRRMAEAVGREIALRGATLVCGGLGGVMEAAAKGAVERIFRTLRDEILDELGDREIDLAQLNI